MKWLKGFWGLVIIFLLVAIITVVVIINPFGASPFNKYTQDGNLLLPGLKEPVTVHRDEKGISLSLYHLRFAILPLSAPDSADGCPPVKSRWTTIGLSSGMHST
jgi:hypothetical protein